MSNARKETFTWQLSSTVRELWPVIADTARFNEAIGFPKHSIDEITQPDNSVRFVAHAKMKGLNVSWDDIPQNWVSEEWFEHKRIFHNGPLKSLLARLAVRPNGNGSKIDYSFELKPANMIGRALVNSGLMFRKIRSDVGRMLKHADEFCLGKKEREYPFPSPKLIRGGEKRAIELGQNIDQTPYGHGLGVKFAHWLITTPDVDVMAIRPLRLARDWGVPERHVVEACLEATRQGMLRMRWDLLCPRCQIGKSPVTTLKELPKGTHCDTCNIDYQRDFSNNVECVFAPSVSIRALEQGEYCLMGAMTTPHIKLQLTVAAGEQRKEYIDLEFGIYRVRTLEPGDEETVDWSQGGFPAIELENDRIKSVSSGDPSTVSISNHNQRLLTVIVEELGWRRDALTAHRATTLQAFRDVMDDEVLRPGDDAAIDSVTIMFTDLKGSTSLYNRIGDPQAYVLVREHFVILGNVVRECNGSIVKMIGDAIMAVFADPADGFQCAVRIHEEINKFNQTSNKEELVIKLGLHIGRCISVTLNGKLDYYGAMANIAARLQSESVGGDIVLSKEFSNDAAVKPLLQTYSLLDETAQLKGFEGDVPFYRISADEISAKHRRHIN